MHAELDLRQVQEGEPCNGSAHWRKQIANLEEQKRGAVEAEDFWRADELKRQHLAPTHACTHARTAYLPTHLPTHLPTRAHAHPPNHPDAHAHAHAHALAHAHAHARTYARMHVCTGT